MQPAAPAFDAAAGVEDQCPAVAGPVWRLERILGTVNDLLSAGFEVEDLEHAADVVAIRHEAVFRGPHETDVLEERALGHVAVVRAEREPNKHLIAERDVRHFRVREWIAELRRRENVGLSLALDLDDVGALDGPLHLLGDGAFRSAELQRGQTIAVDHAIDVGCVRILIRLHHCNPTLR